VIEFKAWPKVPRLFRDVVITEKIDGTNAAVVIEKYEGDIFEFKDKNAFILVLGEDGDMYAVGAQSRTRMIFPEQDNHGFAVWVRTNAAALVDVLGAGTHYGEWWGSGINRGYGLQKGQKYFSLFNASRWDPVYDPETWPQELGIVPIVYEGPFSEAAIQGALRRLRANGSLAHGGFMRPEGIVVFHKAANHMFKVTLENDAAPKALALAA
jgi:hypothetical protein